MGLPEHLQEITVTVEAWTTGKRSGFYLNVSDGINGTASFKVATLDESQDVLAHVYNMGLAQINELRSKANG